MPLTTFSFVFTGISSLLSCWRFHLPVHRKENHTHRTTGGVVPCAVLDKGRSYC